MCVKHLDRLHYLADSHFPTCFCVSTAKHQVRLSGSRDGVGAYFKRLKAKYLRSKKCGLTCDPEMHWNRRGRTAF